MPQQNEKRPAEPDLSSTESSLFEAMFGFHNKVMALLRQSSLDDEKLKLAADRIKTLLADTTAEMVRMKDFDVEGRLEAAYEEVQRLVDELTGSHDRAK